MAHLYVNLVSAQNDRNVFAYALKIAMPVWNIFVGDPRRDIEHDDAALALNVVPVAKTTKLLLAGSIPDVETDSTKVCGEREWMDLYTEGGWGEGETRYESYDGTESEKTALAFKRGRRK